MLNEYKPPIEMSESEFVVWLRSYNELLTRAKHSRPKYNNLARIGSTMAYKHVFNVQRRTLQGMLEDGRKAIEHHGWDYKLEKPFWL